MSKIGLFFGPEKGSVHRVAEKVKNEIGAELVEMIFVNDASSEDMEKYDKIIFGISTVGKETWDSEFSNSDWAKFFPEVRKVDFSNKTIAIFGLGDHITYADYFVNAMGVLAKEILKESPSVKFIGQVDPSDYEFEDSEAIIDGKFIGLPVDEDFEPELTDERVTDWVKTIKADFGL